PYCYYRARELAKRGLRERVVKIKEAPGLPFDTGRFETVLESETGERMPRRLARDRKKRPRGGKLVLCAGCREYFFASEASCPHCGSRNKPAAVAGDD